MINLKRIGVLGGLSAESTTMFYSSLTRLYVEQNGDTGYPEIVVFSVSFKKFYQLVQMKKWDEAAEYLASGINAMEKAGAHFGVISANMPHIAFDLITKHVSLPLIHIADVVAETAKSFKYKKVALIGTKPTMNATFYPDRLSKYQIECIVPYESQQEMINTILETELFKGVVNPDSQMLFLELLHELKERGAEAIILGCTEFPLLINAENSPLPLLDSALLLAKEALKMATIE